MVTSDSAEARRAGSAINALHNFGITGGSALLQLSNSRELLSPLGGQECPPHLMVNICAQGLPSANQLSEETGS
jgi:hypothetical protein